MEQRKMFMRTNLFWLSVILLYLIVSFVNGLFVSNTTTSILLAQAAILIPIAIYLLLTGQNPLKLLKMKKLNLGSAFLVILLTVCIYPIIMFINAVSMIFSTNFTAATITDISGYGLFTALSIMALLPAFVEECMFRGVMLGTYDEGKRPIRAIVFSALAFAMMHMNINQMCYAFFMGLVFGVVVEITGSIWSSMLMHFCINGFSTLVTWALTEFEDQYGDLMTESVSTAASTPAQMLNSALIILPFALIAAGICVLLVKAIAGMNQKQDCIRFWTSKEYKEDRAEIQKVRIFDLPYAIALFICLLLALMQEITAGMVY